MELEKEVDKILHKLKLYLMKNNEIKAIVSRRGNSIILEPNIREEYPIDKS